MRDHEVANKLVKSAGFEDFYDYKARPSYRVDPALAFTVISHDLTDENEALLIAGTSSI